jgi:hypothetical protein
VIDFWSHFAVRNAPAHAEIILRSLLSTARD